MSIYFDIDGVLRDIATPVFGKSPDMWHAKTASGHNIVEYINRHRDILITAPVFEYEQVLKYLVERKKDVRLLTCQPILWQAHTMFWVAKNLTYVEFHDIIIVRTPAEKLAYIMTDDDVLIEDNPEIADYFGRVILIDRPYNRCIKHERRVHNKYQLLNELIKHI
jgi:hypothetical protein